VEKEEEEEEEKGGGVFVKGKVRSSL